MTGINRPEQRLENIQAVEPILSALRTVSQASMQSARRQLSALQRYGSDLLDLTAWLPVEAEVLGPGDEKAQSRMLMIAFGSDRGLCGSFNTDLAKELLNQLNELGTPEVELEVWALGLRLNSALDRRGFHPDHAERFARRSVPEFQKANRLTRRMLESYRTGRYNRVLVLFHRHRRGGRYLSFLEQLLPVEKEGIRRQESEEIWPPPILETDPKGLLRRLLIQAVEINFYEFMLASSEAEHAARYQILENAAQNTEQLMEELQMEVQLARQQAITTEMLDLVAAAGLIKS